MKRVAMVYPTTKADDMRVGDDPEGVLDQPGRTLHQFAFYGVDPRLGALLVLVGCAAADADPTDLHFVRGHDWKPPGKSDDA